MSVLETFEHTRICMSVLETLTKGQLPAPAGRPRRAAAHLCGLGAWAVILDF